MKIIKDVNFIAYLERAVGCLRLYRPFGGHASIAPKSPKLSQCRGLFGNQIGSKPRSIGNLTFYCNFPRRNAVYNIVGQGKIGPDATVMIT